MKIAVIGSGPSGWSATMTLTSLGHEVTVIDSSMIETDQFGIDTLENSSTINRKLYFGSDLPYRAFPVGPTLNSQSVSPISSFARGGLSLVWGATMLPYCEEDTALWPIHISAFDKEFHELSNVIPITGTSDGLSAAYGDFYSRRGIIPSDRIVRILESSKMIKAPDVHVGLSRLAVETGTQNDSGCVYCNRCLTGCPYSFIWNTKDLNFETKFLKLRVIKLRELSSGIVIEAVDIQGNPYSLYEFEKVFLAAGPLESFRILASSNIVNDKSILKDSATFFLPLLALPKLGRLHQNSFGLSQLFIRLNKNETEHASQFQLYEYSEDLIIRAKKALPLGSFIPEFILRFFLSKMLIAIGYLDGENSPSIQMRLLEDGSLLSSLETSGRSFKERNRSVRLAIKRLSTYVRRCGLLPLPFLTQVALPGEGVHFGSWLPMGKESDLLGRPIGSKNIHVIDSSVLPTIGPGPITFTVMANAKRIAKESVK